MDQNMSDVLRIVDFIIELIENPVILQKMDTEYMKKTFQACVFIEKLMIKVEAEQKETDFESHLNYWALKKNKSVTYKCSNLKNVSNKLLELCFKEEKLPNEMIDELLKMYIKEFGSPRLEVCINDILMNSMQANTILQVFKNLDFSQSDIEDEILIASWEQEIITGRHKCVIECMINMFKNQHIPKLIKLAYKSKINSQVNSLILNFFKKKLEDSFELYNELVCSERKVILKLLSDDLNFQQNFIDATFYIGRSMELDEEEGWITENGFTYNDLKNIIKTLLDGSEHLFKLIINRIKVAKELDIVWKDIERDCIL